MVDRLTRGQKRLLILLSHSLLVPLTLYLAFALRFDALVPTPNLVGMQPLFVALTALAPVVIFSARLTSVQALAIDMTALLRLAAAAVIFGLVCVVAGRALDVSVPRSVPIIFGALFFLTALLARNCVAVLIRAPWQAPTGEPVAIYGADNAALQVATDLRRGNAMRPIAFVDDNRGNHGLLIGGLKVISQDQLRALATKGKIKRVLVALPDMPKGRLDQRLKALGNLPCEVQVVPTLTQVISEQGRRPPEVDEDQILGQTPLSLLGDVVGAAFRGKTVLVTGAGGTAGRDICQEVLACQPARLIMLDQSETALFALDREISAVATASGVALEPTLGSITHAERMTAILARAGVDVLIHTASHKNPSILARNVSEAVHTNVLGTHTLIQAAIAARVGRVVLVSSAFSAAPGGVVGVTARMAEHVALDLASRSDATRVTVLRIGHVLGAAGSILALMQRQIKAGGPVRIAHPEATRLFLGRNQAARLAILAAAHTQSGEVLVTDSVAPKRLSELAERLIEVSGDKNTSITFSGLRPGEPLHEVRTSSTQPVVGTSHPNLLQLDVPSLSEIQIAALLQELRGAVAEDDVERIQSALQAFLRDDERLATGTRPT